MLRNRPALRRRTQSYPSGHGSDVAIAPLQRRDLRGLLAKRGGFAMLIGFDVGLLNERGTSVAVYDYAYYAQTILGHDSIVFYQGEASPPILDRFKKQFETISYNTLDDLQRAIEIRRIDLSYFIKQGDNDGRLSRSSKNASMRSFNTSILMAMSMLSRPNGSPTYKRADSIRMFPTSWTCLHRIPTCARS